jgi:hypothetical protein
MSRKRERPAITYAEVEFVVFARFYGENQISIRDSHWPNGRYGELLNPKL